MPEENQNPVLEYGNDAVQKPADAALGYGNSAVEYKDKGKKTPNPKKSPPGKQVVIVSGGYGGYKSDADEIKAMETKWYPNTADFIVAARKIQQNVWGAKKVNNFFAVLTKYDKISKIIFLGHGSSSGIALSGEPGDLQDELTIDELSKWNQWVKDNIVPKLDAGATIEIYACHAAQGLGQPYLKAIANSFERCVNSFAEEVAFEYPELDKDKSKIVKRTGGVATISDAKAKNWKYKLTDVKPPVSVCPD
jgi:hypothetical protein